MKKLLFSVAAAAAAILSVALLPACAEGTENGGDGVTYPSAGGHVEFTSSVVFTASSDVTELTAETSLKNYLDALAAKGELVYDGTEGAYGYFITSVFGIAGQSSDDGSSGYSWMIYTDYTGEGDEVYADPAFGTFVYGGKTLASASYGVSLLPCEEGYTYALVYEAWSY